MPNEYIKKILEASVYDVAVETPLDPAPLLSQRFNNSVFLKREDLQPVFSFKLRGAYNKINSLSAAQLKKGVVTCSAGNHAQGVALAAQKKGIRATIVMPKTTPQIKVDAVKARGVKVVLHGDTYDEASALATQLVKDKGLVMVHPYDDPLVIAGQGTIGMEIMRQTTHPLDAVFVCVGGGGLVAGIASYVKYVSPKTKIIAVEADDAACFKAALDAGKPVDLPSVGIFADGAAVARIGRETFRVAKDLVDDVVTVSTDEICAAIKDIFDDTRAITEPAGALAVAGMKKYLAKKKWNDKTVVAIASGANINFDRLRYISERTEMGEQREAILSVTIPEVPGSFRKFCNVLGKRNISEFNYRYSEGDKANIFVGLQIDPATDDRKVLLATLRDKGYTVSDMSDNDIAKVHVRHMVGGHGASVSDEVVYRFIFPERPGALMAFLNKLGTTWNISMFHYRNHGSAFGRVLLGMQVPKSERDQLAAFFETLGYTYSEESNNIAYKRFLD
ncbi:MAG: threonine ammonia-lyase, biosynthetic [Pseudomonadota bacterium]